MSKTRVMLVDDDQDFVIVQSAVLRRAGYEVLVASDAVSAVSVAMRERPQAVIMDIGLPGGDGTTVMQRLHALPSLAGIPVIVLSGRDPERYRQGALGAGAAAYLTKPAAPEDLLAALEDVLSSATGDEGGTTHSYEHLAGRVVLIVDDDSDLLFALSSALRRYGLEVATAADAIAAMSTAVRVRPDVAVLDIGLPGGDGLTVMQRMHAMPQLAGMPVVLLSGRDPQAYQTAGLDAGATAFLTKPIEVADLLEALDRVLDID
jgi:DNA-binding response OmpR family regulator